MQWNFEKFLLAPGGEVVNRFRPRTEPDAPEVVAAIEAVLPLIPDGRCRLECRNTVPTPARCHTAGVAGQLIVSVSGISDRTLPDVAEFCARSRRPRRFRCLLLVAPRLKGGYRLDRDPRQWNG